MSVDLTQRHWLRNAAHSFLRSLSQWSVDLTPRRHRNRHAFRPALERGLENRELLSTLPGLYFLEHPSPKVAYLHNDPAFIKGKRAYPFPVASNPRGPNVKTETAHGGQSVVVGTPDGSHFILQLTQFVPPSGEGLTANQSANTPGTQSPIQNQVPGGSVVQAIGTVRAYSMPGGKVGIILDGTNNLSELDISNYPFPQRKGYAHSFAYGQTVQTHVLNIGQITVNSGVISAILGYHTADLSGPLTISGTTTVDRLAFDSLLPGASITTGGDLNTLDVLNGVNLTSGTGIHIGRDLNLINVGQDLDLSNGASLIVNRYLGTTPQPPKGTATGSNFLATNQALVGTGTATVVPGLSGNIQGNVNIGAGSSFTVVGGIQNSTVSSTTAAPTPSVFLIDGSLNVSDPNTGVQIPNLIGSNLFSVTVNNPSPPPTTLTYASNLVARNGSTLTAAQHFFQQSTIQPVSTS